MLRKRSSGRSLLMIFRCLCSVFCVPIIFQRRRIVVIPVVVIPDGYSGYKLHVRRYAWALLMSWKWAWASSGDMSRVAGEYLSGW